MDETELAMTYQMTFILIIPIRRTLPQGALRKITTSLL